MTNNNSLIEKPKLNIFQRIRKSGVIFFINNGKFKAKQYSKLPPFMKNDTDIICALLLQDKKNIEYIPKTKYAECIKYDPTIISELERFDLIDLLLKNEIRLKDLEQFCNPFELKYICSTIFDKNKEYALTYNLIKYLDKSEQIDLLLGNFSSKDNSFRENIKIQKIDPNLILSHIKDFPISVLASVIEKIQSEGSNGINLELIIGSKDVPKEILVNLSKKLYENSSNKDFFTKYGDLIKFLPEETQRVICLSIEKSQMSKLSLNVQVSFAKKSDVLKTRISEEAIVKYVDGNLLKFNEMSLKQKNDFIVANDNLKNPECLELLRAHPESFNSKDSRLNGETSGQVMLNKLLTLVENEQIKQRVLSTYSSEYLQAHNSSIGNIAKVLLNDKVMKNITEDSLIEILTNPPFRFR